jgi:polysaccharide export outer membrane protein
LDKYKQTIQIENDLTVYEPIIKKFDELLITVTAPVLSQAKVAQFNLPMTAYLTAGTGNTVQQSPAVQTYTVDYDGAITFPVIGRIPLAGLTKSQAIERIKKSVSDYVDDPVITVKLMSFHVTVLGEVNKPGTLSVNQEKISILDAIGAANDLTIYGNRENVLLIRENNDGTNDFIRLDLTKSDIFTSPFYYLQQNDKIVVEPNKTRQLDSKYGVADGYKLSIFSMVFSAVSIIASTAVAIISIRKN